MDVLEKKVLESFLEEIKTNSEKSVIESRRYIRLYNSHISGITYEAGHDFSIYKPKKYTKEEHTASIYNLKDENGAICHKKLNIFITLNDEEYNYVEKKIKEFMKKEEEAIEKKETEIKKIKMEKYLNGEIEQQEINQEKPKKSFWNSIFG
jgi:sulfite reductase alpha subunit-like flavoprotein